MSTNLSPFSLKDKNIVVTGASSGIGRQIAIECSRFGARLIIIGRNQEKLNQTLDLLEGHNHILIKEDLTNFELINNKLNDINVPLIDGIVHSAGIIKIAPIKICTISDIEEVFKINILGSVSLTKHLLSNNKIKKGGSVIFISSVNGISKFVKGFSAYAASKAALSSFTKSFALEYAKKRIRFNTINPGMVKTEMLVEMQKFLSNELIELDKSKYPFNDYCDKEDIAYASIYLLSNASKWVTGTSITIDGGLSIN
jgi:NAD(P)-dependent dehydrogenase (short-subunit alcohol dehydrogenase family)